MQSEADAPRYSSFLWFDVPKGELPKDSLRYRIQNLTDEMYIVLHRGYETHEEKHTDESILSVHQRPYGAAIPN